MQRGDSNTLSIKVNNTTGGQPLSGALVSLVVTYPEGLLQKSNIAFTDNSGPATISFPTGDRIKSDTVNLGISVSLTG